MPPSGQGSGTGHDSRSGALRAARFWRVVNRLADLAPAGVGISPADVALRHDRMTLWRYRPAAAPAAAPPVLVVHGFIGRASVTDLAPGRSLVADLLAAGVDVWTIHWGQPSRADRFMRIEDYLDDHLDACVRAMHRATGRAPVLLGICEGGLFALCHAALAPGAVAGLALAVTPVDPHAVPDAVLMRWVRAFTPADLDRLIDSLGGLPGPAMGAAFQAMTPARTMAKYTSGLLAMADDPEALRGFAAMETWLADRPDHPAAAARQLVVEHYHEARLTRGPWALGERVVDLAALRLPIFSAYGLHDHLVPPAQAQAIVRLAPAARHTDCPLDAGHIGIFVSRRARGQLAARLVAWLGDQAVFGASLA